jgi:hypothetical protein
MSKILLAVVFTAALFVAVAPAYAAPFNAANNPKIVANYSSGDHGIPGEPYLHQGADVVMCNNNGLCQQWFVGTSEEPGDAFHGDHSVWKPESLGSGQPKSNETVVPNANTAWGDYLAPGDYFVTTNDFLNGQGTGQPIP